MASLRPDLKVIEEVDKADVSYGSTLMAEVLTAHPDIVGVGGLDTTAGQCAANAVESTGRKDVIIIAGALDEAQTQYWPLLKSGVIQACVLSSSFEQFWTAMQFLVNLNTNAIDGINWRANKEFRVVPKNVDLGSFTVTKADVPTLKSIKLI
jgi:ribose transport system substrate-binding protein